METTCTTPGCPSEGIPGDTPPSDIIVCGGCGAVLHDPLGLVERVEVR